MLARNLLWWCAKYVVGKVMSLRIWKFMCQSPMRFLVCIQPFGSYWSSSLFYWGVRLWRTHIHDSKSQNYTRRKFFHCDVYVEFGRLQLGFCIFTQLSGSGLFSVDCLYWAVSNKSIGTSDAWRLPQGYGREERGAGAVHRPAHPEVHEEGCVFLKAFYNFK